MSKTLKTLWQLFYKARGGMLECDRFEEQAHSQAPQSQQQGEPVARARKDLTRYSKITVRLPTHIVKTYKHLAIELQMTMQDLVAIALAYYLEKELKTGGDQNADRKIP
jgi:hypothetical protein